MENFIFSDLGAWRRQFRSGENGLRFRSFCELKVSYGEPSRPSNGSGLFLQIGHQHAPLL